MHSNQRFIFAAGALLLAAVMNLTTGCGPKNTTADDEYIIGSKLSEVTPLRTSSGAQNTTMVMFDDVLRKVHEFNISPLQKTRTLWVNNPGVPHYELHDPVGNYIIDLSLKGFTIFDSHNHMQNDPVHLQGTPRSAAFDPVAGYLVLYDNLMNVGIVNLSATGTILKAGAFGPLIGNATIASGDVVSPGVLELSLSDGTLATVNLAQTLTNNAWSYTIASTSFSSGFSWVAPVAGFAQEVLVKSGRMIALLNTASGATLSSYSESSRFVKLSKSINAHTIAGDDQNLDLIYTDGAAVRTRHMYNQSAEIMDSQLDLNGNNWLVVNGSEQYEFDIFSGDVNVIKSNRQLKTFRISDMMAATNMPLPNDGQVLLGSNFFLALMPSDLGDVYTLNYVTGQRIEKTGFNTKEYDNH